MTNSSVSTITICYSARSESCGSSSSKACREKQRRDRLNDKCVLFSDNLLIHLSFSLFSHSYSSFAVTHNSQISGIGSFDGSWKASKNWQGCHFGWCCSNGDSVAYWNPEVEGLKPKSSREDKRTQSNSFFFTFFVYSSLLARISFCNPSFSFSWGRGMFLATDLILVPFAMCNEVIVCSIYSLQPTFLISMVML